MSCNHAWTCGDCFTESALDEVETATEKRVRAALARRFEQEAERYDDSFNRSAAAVGDAWKRAARLARRGRLNGIVKREPSTTKGGTK